MKKTIDDQELKIRDYNDKEIQLRQLTEQINECEESIKEY